MRRLYMLFLLVFAMSIVGCYSDKGNYDYKDIQKIEFTFDKFAVSATVGDTLVVDPKLSQEIDESSVNHSFEWLLNGKIRPDWNKKIFTWIVDEVMMNADLAIKVTDKRNGVVYSSKIRVDVIGLFENSHSYIILSDVGGASRLSYMSTLETESKEGSNQVHIKRSKFYKDVYTDANNGESLGSGPISMQEHFRKTSNLFRDVQVGSITVFQQSGAVDLRGEDFAKDLDMSKVFVGGKYPDGVVLHPGTYMDLIDLVTDQNGKIYSRLKATSEVFHSEYFLHKPRRVDGEIEELSQCQVVRGFYSTNRFGYAVIYDGKNERMLSMTNSGHSGGSSFLDAGRIEPFFPLIDGIETSGTIPLGNTKGYELLYVKQGGTRITSTYIFQFVFRNKSSNELFLQNVTAGYLGYSAPAYTKAITCEKILGLPGIPSRIALPIFDKQEFGFFAVDNTLYLVDLVALDRPAVPYYVFDSKITALNCDSRVTNRHLAVGLENGGFYVLGTVDARNIQEENKLIYSSPEKVGKIVDICYKNSDMMINY